MNKGILFTEEDAFAAHDEWGFNCGPSALCAVLAMTPKQIRPLMLDFETKRYSNPTLVKGVLSRLHTPWKEVFRSDDPKAVCKYPNHGLMRVQWGGPWTKEGAPMAARYRQTHWVAVRLFDDARGHEIFDVNAMEVGGWIPFELWRTKLVPWLIKQCVKRGDGTWWITHALEVARP